VTGGFHDERVPRIAFVSSSGLAPSSSATGSAMATFCPETPGQELRKSKCLALPEN
jgi:hypothetical protein